MTYLDDLATVLVNASVASTALIYKGRPPEDVATLVALIPYAGSPPERTHSGTDRRFPRIQVLCRDYHPDLAVARAEAVRAAFRAAGSFSVSTTHYEAILPIGEHYVLAHDLRGRFPVVTNYEVRFHVS